jgi:ATP-dependent Clp protease ATP-binding subunit ClpB
MNLSKLTEKAQEAVVEAQRLAETRQHTQVEPEHLLAALIAQENGVVPAILDKLGVPPAQVSQTSGRRPAQLRPRDDARPTGLCLASVSAAVRRRAAGSRAAQGRFVSTEYFYWR